jgi:DNA repair protein RecN (Recombination protein N)
MLQEVRISNFAIIEDLVIHFGSGLNVLTGETGAGKSILIDAIELLVGGRASADQIRSGCQEALIEGIFELPQNGPAFLRFRDMGLVDAKSDELFIRRIIHRSGKSRIYLNDNLITLTTLQELGIRLVEIHGQHESQSLLNSETQLRLLDAFGKLIALREAYEEKYTRLLKYQKEFETLRQNLAERDQRADFIRYQLQEIQSAKLQPGEQESLRKERERLANAHRLASAVEEILRLLSESDQALLDPVAKIGLLLKDAIRFDETLSEAIGIWETASLSLKELSQQLRRYSSHIEHDPNRLARVEERMDLIQRLNKKYGKAVEDIMETANSLKTELETLDTSEERLKSIDQDLTAAGKAAWSLAHQLSKERQQAALRLKESVEQELAKLKMADTQFMIQIAPASPDGSDEDQERLSPAGMDLVQFSLSTNPGEPFKPLHRIASGGELSRVALALKVVLSNADQTPILIFDEVDSGIGGGAALVIGRQLKAVSELHQVLCITHLPQIASFADRHLRVEKVVQDGRAITMVKCVEDLKRVEEIARMLGGEQITPTAIQHAQQMLRHQKSRIPTRKSEKAR